MLRFYGRWRAVHGFRWRVARDVFWRYHGWLCAARFLLLPQRFNLWLYKVFG